MCSILQVSAKIGSVSVRMWLLNVCFLRCSYTIDGLVFILHLSKECSQRSWAWLKSCLGYPAVLAHEQSKFDVAIEAVLDYKSLSQQYYGRVCSS